MGRSYNRFYGVIIYEIRKNFKIPHVRFEIRHIFKIERALEYFVCGCVFIAPNDFVFFFFENYNFKPTRFLNLNVAKSPNKIQQYQGKVSKTLRNVSTVWALQFKIRVITTHKYRADFFRYSLNFFRRTRLIVIFLTIVFFLFWSLFRFSLLRGNIL